MIAKEYKRLAEVDFPIAVVSKHAAKGGCQEPFREENPPAYPFTVYFLAGPVAAFARMRRQPLEEKPAFLRMRLQSVNDYPPATADFPGKSACLEPLSELTPEVRFGQLIANLSYLAIDSTNEAIWDMEDEQLLEAIRQHSAALAQRQSSVA